jgi:hypothetical protein
MPIDRDNLGAVLFLRELSIQCSLFSRAIERLEEGAEHWRAIDRGEDDGKTFAPIEIVAQCVVCLAALAAIQRILFIGGRRKAPVPIRCAALLSLLAHPALPNMSSVQVRNAWEHLDERLDDLLKGSPPQMVEQIRVSGKPPDPNLTWLRRFDPGTFTIHFANQSIDLRPCIEEVKLLTERIKLAYPQLEANKFPIN